MELDEKARAAFELVLADAYRRNVPSEHLRYDIITAFKAGLAHQAQADAERIADLDTAGKALALRVADLERENADLRRAQEQSAAHLDNLMNGGGQ
jgi:cell division protein FtsB